MYISLIGKELDEVLSVLETKNKEIIISETKPHFQYEGAGRKIVLNIKEQDNKLLIIYTNEINEKIFKDPASK